MFENDSLEFDNVNSFSMYIEEYCKQNKVSYIEAIRTYCETQYVDYEEIKILIHPTLKEKIRKEFVEMGMLSNIGDLGF